MTRRQRDARDSAIDQLLRRRDDDDRALRDAFEMAADYPQNDGAERLRLWALGAYS